MVKRIKAGDIAMLTAVVFLCLICLVIEKNTGGKAVAQIYSDGILTQSIMLENAQNRQLELNGTVIEVQKGKIRFLQSDCPDKLCVKCGWLENNGDTAACVPNKTVIVIKNSKGKTAHAVTY